MCTASRARHTVRSRDPKEEGRGAVGLDHRETTLKNDLQVKYLGVLEVVFDSNLEYKPGALQRKKL